MLTPIDDTGQVTDPASSVQLLHNSGNQSLEGSIVAVIPIDNYGPQRKRLFYNSCTWQVFQL